MPSLWTTTLIVLAFFFAYYVYEPPYRGLYPDLLHEAVYGRAQGAQHLMRGLALGTAVLGGLGLFHSGTRLRSYSRGRRRRGLRGADRVRRRGRRRGTGVRGRRHLPAPLVAGVHGQPDVDGS